LALGIAAVLVLGFVVPWPVTVSGPLVVAPSLAIPLIAPDSGTIERVRVREGSRVAAGAPLLVIRNLELEREMVAHQRVVDSLAIRSAQARALTRSADVAMLDAMRSMEQANLAGIRKRINELAIRALGTGVVVTSRPEELAGQWVSEGVEVLRLGQPDSVEARIALSGAGATLVRQGQQVRLLSNATFEAPIRTTVSGVSAAGDSPSRLEARVRLAAGTSWRPGMRGEARVTLWSSNIWGALWWGVRSRIRNDILL
jgi:multidrug resistance efflux pump